MPDPVFTGWDDNGDPLSGGLLYTYSAGTTTPLATYSDVGLTTPNANPVVLNSAGRATVYLSATSYKFVLKTSAGATVWTQDNVSAVPTTSGDVDITGTAGEALAAGTVAYLSDGSGSLTAGRWYLADGDLTYASVDAQTIAMVPTAIASGASGTLRRMGRMTGLSGLSAGTMYYASGTAGALTSAVPAYARLVGVADTTTTLVLTPAPTFAGVAPALSAAVASNILTVSLTTPAGSAPSVSKPVQITFRDPTVATGAMTSILVSAATTVAVPDTALLGTSNSVAFHAWIVAFNDAGTVRLGIINCASSTSIYPLAGWGIASSTAMSTGSDSAQVFYTGVAVTAKAYTVLGYVSYESGLATAGTWSAAPTRVQALTTETPLPGQPVQVVAANYTTQTASSSSTYADTGLTASITPSSAANRVQARSLTCGCYKDSVSAAQALGLKLLRGATVLGFQHSGNNGTAAVATFGTMGFEVLDAPNSAAALTYKVQFAAEANAATVYVQEGASQSAITLTEVMA